MPRGNRPSASAEPQDQLIGPALHISLELSQATWLVTALIPGGDKMSKLTTPGGDGAALIELVNRLRAKIDPRSPDTVPVIAIEEAGLDCESAPKSDPTCPKVRHWFSGTLSSSVRHPIGFQSWL
jgi:hypothetical protein